MFDSIPDVANQHLAQSQFQSRLDRVGMSQIEIPIRIAIPGFGVQMTTGRAGAYVSLDDPISKGIHMSRLFLNLQSILETETFSYDLVVKVLEAFIESHKSMSCSAHVSIEFEQPMKRKALLSDNSGWRSYPAKISATLKDGEITSKISYQVTYSSTCPCSAALARQLIQKKFLETYEDRDSMSREEVLEWLGREDSILATPHGQRSHANVTIIPKTLESAPLFSDLIDQTENALKTPVQTAVKREDEQEFARLNGANLMFAEDAARRVGAMLDGNQEISDYKVETIHYESLHAHNAVAMTTKGAKGGLETDI